MAGNVVSSMKKMAENGKTIVTTIHQPNSQVFAMFDRVLLLASGQVAFLGNVGEANELFHRLVFVINSK